MEILVAKLGGVLASNESRPDRLHTGSYRAKAAANGAPGEKGRATGDNLIVEQECRRITSQNNFIAVLKQFCWNDLF